MDWFSRLWWRLEKWFIFRAIEGPERVEVASGEHEGFEEGA